MREREHDIFVKLLMVGNTGAGKSALLNRFSTGEYSTNIQPTIGIDFRNANMAVGEHRVRCQIWDTAGQERFRSITTSYFGGAMGLLLCYDISCRESFESVGYWARQARDHTGPGPIDIVLVGNKVDLAEAPGSRVVSEEEGRALAASFTPPVRFFETSAKQNLRTEHCFLSVVEDVVERILRDPTRARAAGRSPVRGGGGAAFGLEGSDPSCLTPPSCCTIS